MKSAKQVREFVRRRTLQETVIYLKYLRENKGKPVFLADHPSRIREVAFIEILNAFDTRHKTKLKMPLLPKAKDGWSGLRFTKK